jgi:chromosome segregation ATPase
VGSQPALLARKQQMQLDLNRQQQRLAQIANQLDSLTRRQSDRAADREALQMQRAALEEMQTALQTELKATMAHLEAAGLLPASPADLAEVEAQLRSTAETLLRVKAHIGMLQEPGNAPAEAVSGAQPVSLEQLEVARHNLQQKLAGLKNRYSQMAAQGQNGWAGVPRQVKLSLELARNRLAEMGVELGKLEIEETANRRLDEAIAQLGREQESLQTALDQLHYELQQVQEKLEATDQQEPRVAVTDTLWPGVELTMLSETRRFNEPVRAASLGLSADRQGPIVAVNLR